MAKSKTPETISPVASTLIKPREEVKRLVEAQIVAADSILEMQVAKVAESYTYDMFGSPRTRVDKYDEVQQDEFLRQYKIWNNRCKEILTRSFEHPNNTDLDGYEKSGRSYFIRDIVEEQKKGIRDQVAFMRGFIDRLDLIPCMIDEGVSESTKVAIDAKKVFIVHGHNDSLKVDVARTVEQMGLKAIILHEQDDYGETIIQKFENNAIDIGFAIILLTGDDLAVSNRDLEREKKEKDFNAKYHLRARQNVVFEMGYFIGKLDRAHVVELLEADVEKPGDLDGTLYIPIDKEGMWRLKLAKRLKSVGYSVDIDAII